MKKYIVISYRGLCAAVECEGDFLASEFKNALAKAGVEGMTAQVSGKLPERAAIMPSIPAAVSGMVLVASGGTRAVVGFPQRSFVVAPQPKTTPPHRPRPLTHPTTNVGDALFAALRAS